MKQSTCRIVVVSLVMVCLAFSGPARVDAQTAELPADAQALLAIGKAGPNAVDLTIRTDKPEGYTFKPGDSLVIHLKTSRKAYVTAIYLSSKGDAIILFPNSQAPENTLDPNKEYTLFGDDSVVKLKISDRMKEGRIVFYASSVPLDLGTLKPPAGQPVIQIPHTATDLLATLKRKLEGLSNDDSFNRVVMGLKTGGEEGVSLKLMGLPSGIGSERPETVTGVQGVKNQAVK